MAAQAGGRCLYFYDYHNYSALSCSSSSYNTKLSSSPNLAISTRSHRPICFSPTAPYQHNRRHLSSGISAVNTRKVATQSRPIRLTYLEGNSWLWDVGGLNILVDPILVGNLDFGVPWLYDAAKRVIKNFRIEDLPELDLLLITQSLDDHCHVKTLKPLSEMLPDLQVIATPNAEAILKPMFSNVVYLEPGQRSEVEGKNGAKVNVRATAGPILGPPWQRPENGYLITSGEFELTLYYEPHCVYNHSLLQEVQADVIITPVIKQLLPAFTLVSGQEDAVRLAKLLQAKFIVPMQNGDLDSKGILSRIIYNEGTINSFKELLSREIPDAQVLEPTPGVPLEISLSSSIPQRSSTFEGI